MRSKFLFLFFFLSLSFVEAQDRYMVFFKDKMSTPYSLDRPFEYLSQRAIDRREKNGVAIDDSDLPVDPSYIDQLKALGIETFFTTKWMNGVIVQMRETEVETIEQLAFVSEIEYVGPGRWLSDNPSEYRYTTELFPNPDNVEPTAFQNEMLGVDVMHNNQYFGEGVLVGVFDNGFANYRSIPAFQHLLEENRILYTKDFTSNANQVENYGTHGTRVLSIMAGDDGTFKGVAPKATYILSITEAPGEYRVEEYNWLFAAEKADSAGVDVINTSLGYTTFFDVEMSYTPEDMNGQTTVISRASQMAIDKGIVLFNSAGNAGASTWQKIVAPADVPEVISVGALERSGFKSVFSSIGPNADGVLKPDVVALGVGTSLIDWDGKYKNQNGTSFSSPLVAGLAIGVLGAYPELTAQELRSVILQSSDLYDTPNNGLGYGIPSFVGIDNIVNLQATFEPLDIKVFPNPATEGVVRIALGEGLEGNMLSISVRDHNGRVYMKKALESDQQTVSLDLEGFVPGVYLVLIASESGFATKKLLIQ